MSAIPGPAARGYLTVTGQEPSGDKMAKILYLDEAGVKLNEQDDPFLVVAGVLVDVDKEWRHVKAELQRVADDWLPPYGRPSVFHAADIYHGTGYWDRQVWPSEIRNEILKNIFSIIERLNLPLIADFVEKSSFGDNAPDIPLGTPQTKSMMMHGMAASNCMSWADRWLAKFAPDENATVTAEDRTGVRNGLRRAMVILKDPALIQSYGLGLVPYLPLKRIIDGVTFQRKDEALALQLADVSAFILVRGLNGKHLPDGLIERLTQAVFTTRFSIDESLRDKITDRRQRATPSSGQVA